MPCSSVTTIFEYWYTEDVLRHQRPCVVMLVLVSFELASKWYTEDVLRHQRPWVMLVLVTSTLPSFIFDSSLRLYVFDFASLRHLSFRTSTIGNQVLRGEIMSCCAFPSFANAWNSNSQLKSTSAETSQLSSTLLRSQLRYLLRNLSCTFLCSVFDLFDTLDHLRSFDNLDLDPLGSDSEI